MTTLSVILPNVSGREAQLRRTIDAYNANTPIRPQIIVAKNWGGAGAAWHEGYKLATGDYIMVGSDDMEPQPGWFETARETIEMGFLPAAKIIFEDGRIDSFGSMGGGMHLGEVPDMTPCRQSQIWFSDRAAVDKIGLPLPIHYYTDDDWCWRAALCGYRFVVRHGFYFIHRHRSDAASNDVNSVALKAREQFLRHCGELHYQY